MIHLHSSQNHHTRWNEPKHVEWGRMGLNFD